MFLSRCGFVLGHRREGGGEGVCSTKVLGNICKLGRAETHE